MDERPDDPVDLVDLWLKTRLESRNLAGMMALAAATKDKDDAAACLNTGTSEMKVNRLHSSGNNSVRFFGLSSTLENWVGLIF